MNSLPVRGAMVTKLLVPESRTYRPLTSCLSINVGGSPVLSRFALVSIFRAWMDRRDGFIAVALYLYDAGKHDAYRSLEMKRSTIDAALGDQVSEWRPPGAGRPAGYVAPMKKYADPMDESDWETHFVWLQEKLERFDEVFRPIVKRL